MSPLVPVAAKGDDPAHEHADVRFVLATARPELARPEKPGAELRWLGLQEARRLVTAPNVHEMLSRAARKAFAEREPTS